MRRIVIVLGLIAGLFACEGRRELIYVSAEQGEQIVEIDGLRGEIVRRIPVGKRPRGLALSRDGARLFVAESGSPRAGPNVDESQLPPPDRAADGIGVIDLRSGKRSRSLASGQDPETFDLARDGARLFISNEETAELSVLEIASGRLVQRVPVGREPEGVTLSPDGKRVFVTAEADDEVTVVDSERLNVVARIPTGRRPRAIAFSRDGAIAFVSNELSASVSVLDARSNRAIQTIAIPAQDGLEQRPMGLALSPDGTRLYVSTGRGRAVAVIDVPKRAVAHVIREVGARPWGIAISTDGKRLYTANGPSEDVSIVDLASATVVKRVHVGGSPWGVIAARQ